MELFLELQYYLKKILFKHFFLQMSITVIKKYIHLMIIKIKNKA